MDMNSLEPGHVLASEVFLVAEASLLVDRRGQSYYNLTLNHEGGRQIDGKVWSDNLGDKIEPGQGIEVLARVDEYQGKIQLNVQRYRILSPEEFDTGRYVRSADVDAHAAFETLFNWDGGEFVSPFYRPLMRELHGNEAFAAQFRESPAASRHHHNYRGGLVEHTLEVWNMAEAIAAVYPDRFDRELLMCGAALHDVGKIRSYELKAGISERTVHGNLLDHIFISASMVSNLWDRIVRPEVEDQEAARAEQCKALLLHLILSHHGQREWGSPVLPMTPEAVVLHFCDQISASLRPCFDALENAAPDARWTDRLYIMDEGRRLFIQRGGDD